MVSDRATPADREKTSHHAGATLFGHRASSITAASPEEAQISRLFLEQNFLDWLQKNILPGDTNTGTINNKTTLASKWVFFCLQLISDGQYLSKQERWLLGEKYHFLINT